MIRKDRGSIWNVAAKEEEEEGGGGGTEGVGKIIYTVKAMFLCVWNRRRAIGKVKLEAAP
jgi:hypothetical protein